MELKTKCHGIHQYEEKDIITFKNGFPGFKDLKKFIMFPVEDNTMFSILHAIEDEQIGFIVVSPFDVMKDYELNLDDEIIEKLKIKNSEAVMIVNTVTLSSKIEDITTNLRAPIVINTKEMLGEQLILNNENYLIKYPLFKGDA
ncbi:flagellar assembly protein FliW [Clostridium aestuarii]|uniref:Flagellar assembly factor FliW n=1 Tax=Clostridium aestuarii TaxID=338193 RepID=A0ABT4CXR9_9CLOT|nr:flagellar assembly protein FliW [Clostridium aestuarii]MCY6483657.1 flagellar assembly protein FliW [Clostridium aestuarii]